MRTTEKQCLLCPLSWTLYCIGGTVPLWLFFVDLGLRSAGFGRVIPSNLAYTLFAAGLSIAIMASLTASHTRKRMVLCGAALLVTGFAYLIMVFISLLMIGPINPG